MVATFGILSVLLCFLEDDECTREDAYIRG